jgi:hypothetical protein
MSTGVSRTTPTPQAQSGSAAGAERPRDAESASKFRESLQETRSDRDSMSGLQDNLGGRGDIRMDDGGRGREQGRVDADGGGRGNQRGDEKGSRDDRGDTRARDPRMGPSQPKGLPGPPMKGPKLPGTPGPQPNQTGMSRGLLPTGQMKKQPPGVSVRGRSPFDGGKGMGTLLGQKPKPMLKQTKTLGSRGMLPKGLRPELKPKDPRFRGTLSSAEAMPRKPATPLRTPPPSAGAPLRGSGAREGVEGGEKMPQLGLSQHSRPVDRPEHRFEDAGRIDREAFDPLREVREKEARVVELPVQAKPAVELQKVAPAEQLQQTQRMSSVEIAEIVKKVEKMVSNVRLETTRAGDQQMSLTMSDGRLKGVEIKVSMDKNGKINAEFKAEDVGARNLLTENVKELEKAMQAKGLEINKLEVGSDAAGRQNFANQQDQQRKHESAQQGLDALDAVTGPENVVRDPRMSGARRPAGAGRPGTPGVGAPAAGQAIPTGDGSVSSNYIA